MFSLRRTQLIVSIFVLTGLIFPVCFAQEQKGNQERRVGFLERWLKFRRGPGDYKFFLIHRGKKRTYIVHVPPSYNRRNLMPVVMAFHGGGGNAQGSVEYFNLNVKADTENFIVVYPQGTGKTLRGKVIGSWNAGRCCPSAMNEGIDDVGFIAKMIKKVKRDFKVDPKRVFATGHSNGALISYRLACQLSDTIAAIAVAGAHDSFDGCSPQRPVPVIHFHGTEDKCALYNGGKCGGCFASFLNQVGLPAKAHQWDCRPVKEYIELWRKINKCSEKWRVNFKKGNARCITYSECQDEAEVTLCTIEGMGHTWPGGKYSFGACKVDSESRMCKMWKDTVGDLSRDISANEVMWEFFKKHPKP